MLLDSSTRVTAPGTAPTDGTDLATLRLVCLVRAGDGYVVRAVGELAAPLPGRRQVDITFGDAADRGRAGELAAAVRLIQRWCDDGTTVSLVESGNRLALRAGDGTEAVLPRGA
jgi:hypothetical protein